MRTALAVLLILGVLYVATGSPFAIAGDTGPGENATMPAYLIGGDTGPGENAGRIGFQLVAGDTGPGENA